MKWMSVFLTATVLGFVSAALTAQVRWQQKISDTEGGFSGGLVDGDWFGYGLVGLGDLNDDGTPDIAVGAIGDDTGGTDRGALWVLFLDSTGAVSSHQKIASGVGGFPDVLRDDDLFGFSLEGLGDLDGDGVEDVAVGSRYSDDGGADRGAVWVLFLNVDGTVKSQVEISSGLGGFTGALDDGDQFGTALGVLGDLDGDGVTDLAVAAGGDDDHSGHHVGAIWILFLNSDGTVKSQEKISHTSGGFSGTLTTGDFFPAALCGLRDLDGDGVVDLAASARADSDGGVQRGAVWVLFLNASGTVKGHQKISDTEGGFGGLLNDYDGIGESLCSPGDIDRDGVPDMIAGGSGDDDGGTNRGALWILYLNGDGTTKAWEKVSDTSGGFTGGLSDLDGFGVSAGAIGDIDGNGIGDLAVGAIGDDDGGTERGAAWILSLYGRGSATARFRNAGTNPASYTASTLPVLGTDYVATVDLAGTTWHTYAMLAGYSAPFTFTLGYGQTALVDPTGPELLGFPLAVGPVATFSISIPPDPAYCGYEVCTQAAHVGGVVPFALSNAQDLHLGY